MNTPQNPMRWPKQWTQPAALALLQGTPVDCLVMEAGTDLGAVATQAAAKGMAVISNGQTPAGVRMVKGEWPGVQASRSGGDASAGPTGNPWVDSNGCKIRLESALHPGTAIWVDAAPQEARSTAGAYSLAAADAAAHGGRWILTLEPGLAERLRAGETAAAAAWKRLADTCAFFSEHKEWAGYVPRAVIGVVSDFAGDNEFMGQELLNLVTRTNQQYSIVIKGSVEATTLAGLRALIYADSAPPDAALRRRILAFVEAGSLLITGPNWGVAPGRELAEEIHPRFTARALGKGRIAMARAPFDDPYVVANDAVLLMSHRHELLRFWNGGSVGSFFTASKDGKRAVIHMLLYAGRGPSDAAVRVAGKFSAGKLWTLERPEARRLDFVAQKDALELPLPQMQQYAAAELEA
jgi:hypothetical protein